MQIHDFVLVAQLLRQLEEKAHLQRAILNALLALYLGLFELAEGVETARLVHKDLLVGIPTLDQFVVNSDGLAVIEEGVKVAEGKDCD